ncbi:MAG: hypothetical protein HYY05_06545 [Chloroflexi bacterium]|nr:hypothetical protein [Chloroflexota bacterium]
MNVTADPSIRGQAVADITAWLQYVYDAIGEGEEGVRAKLQPDPFYARNPLLSEAIVEAVLHEIEFGVFQHEIDRFRDYHNAQQGIRPDEVLTRPGFTELPYPAKLCLVQGMDRILQRIRTD